MKAFLIISVCLFSGCGLMPHGLDLDITGKNLETPYGKVEDGHIIVHTSWGKCNAPAPGPTTNSAK